MTARLLDAADAVLLDFDGPVCSVFAGYPAPEVARLLRRLVPDVVRAGALPDADDPLAVLRAVHRCRPHLVPLVDDALTAAEDLALRTATATLGAAELLADCQRAGQPVVIVSNNAAAGIGRYLRRTGLNDLVRAVIGRPVHQPQLMKPHPSMIVNALGLLGVRPGRALMIGDSVSDITAARRCGVRAIGLADRAGKWRALAAAGADDVVDSMVRLTRARV